MKNKILKTMKKKLYVWSSNSFDNWNNSNGNIII